MIPNVLFFATTFYEIVTVPLYWRIIYVLITNPEFSSPFFQFLWIIGICENIHYVTDVIYYRMPMFEWTAELFGRNPSRMLSLAPFLIYFFNYPVYFMQVIISINRLTGVWWPMKHKKYWNIWWRPIVAIAFLISICLTAHRLPFNATTQIVPFDSAYPEFGYTTAIIKYDYYSLDTNLTTGIFNSIVVILSVFINAGTLIKIIKLRKSGNLANVSKAKLEMGLFIIVLWMMCTLIVLIIFQATLYILKNGLISPIGSVQTKYATYIVYLQQPWVDDVGSVSHPWVLILMSESIRNAALPFLKGALFFATTLYEIVTVPLYLRIIYVLITNPKFSDPLFQFLWIIGICEIIHYVADVIYCRLTMLEWTAELFDKSPSRMLSFAPFLLYFFKYPVNFMQLAISINRFTGLWRPVQHKIFWECWWRKLVLLAFIISAIMTFHRCPLNATTQLVPFVEDYPQFGYTPAFIKYEYYSLDTNLLTAVYNSIVVILSMFINAGTLIKIIKLRRSGNLANVSKAKLEMGLFIIVLWMMCTLTMLIIFQSTLSILRSGLISPVGSVQTKFAIYYVFLQQPWVDDVGSVSYPWVIILMSESIRNAALPFLKGFF